MDPYINRVMAIGNNGNNNAGLHYLKRKCRSCPQILHLFKSCCSYFTH